MTSPLQLIREFRGRSGTGAFTNISRSDVADDLEKLINGSVAINQRGASLCGPAAFLYCVSKDKPEVFVNYVTNLYENGEASLGSIKVTPGSSLKKYKPPAGKIRSADWIALASLRDSENAIWNYDEISDEFAGITMPGKMKEWFDEAGYSQTKENTGVMFHEDKENLKKATGFINQGRRVCLFICAGKMMDGKKVKKNSSWPDHWVVLRHPPTISGDQISITVFTWGRETYRIPQTGTLSLDNFVEHYYGYVSAKA